MRAIIHIGFMKTGSTSLQKGLYHSRKPLLEHAILYPDLGTFQHFGLIPLFLDEPGTFNRARMQGLDKEGALQWGRSQASALDLQIQESNADVCILSSEFFSSLRIRELEKFKHFLDIRFGDYVLVGYVRSAADAYSSILQESIKDGNHQPVKDNLYPWTFQIGTAKQLNMFLEVFSLEQMKVFDFSKKSLIGNDIIQDFSYRLHIPKIVESKQANQSLSTIHIAMLFLLGQYLLKWNPDGTINEDRNVMKRKIIKSINNLENFKHYPRFKVDNPRWLNAIKASNFENDAWIDDTFFGGSRSFLKSYHSEIKSQKNNFSKQEFIQYIMSPLTTDIIFEILLAFIRNDHSDFKGKRTFEE